ncbi:MAG: CHAD domain-containing protein, partial [Magnetococcales bacterium]|nr:CHAD domain-containing protein [Magnetococcales bacterium]
PNRFFQTVLALGRHFSGVFEPLTPLTRGFARLDPAVVPMVPWNGNRTVEGGCVSEVLSKTGESLLRWVMDHLAPLVYGLQESRQEAVINLSFAVTRLRFLLGVFHVFLPERVAQEMQTELTWFADELAPLQAWNGLLQEGLRPMRARFSDYPLLGQVIEQAEEQMELAFQQGVRAVESFRFTQLISGIAGWLIGGDGLRAALIESDPLFVERLRGPAEGVVREELRRTHKLVVDRGRKYWRDAEGDLVEFLPFVEALSQVVLLFIELSTDKKGLRYQEAVVMLDRELKGLARLVGDQRLWGELDSGAEEAVRHLFNGWQGARMEQGVRGCKRSWEGFMASPVPFG